jgi:hypothetical protein
VDDREAVARQLGREPAPFVRVAARCPFGHPAVVENAPYRPDGTPFPTSHYLTCPGLRRAVSRLEDEGVIGELEAAIGASPAARAALAAAQAHERRVRAAADAALARGAPRLDDGESSARGIAGTGDDRRLKCLHAHAALALAWPGHVLGEWVLWRALPGGWCAGPGACVPAAAVGGEPPSDHPARSS